jgi:hypothetical protein
MIYEQRTYTLPHGKMSEYLARYERNGLPLQMKYLGRLLGFFVSDVGPLNQVIHIWAYDSYADRECRRAALEEDPAWIAFKETNRGSFLAQEVKIMRPAPFCPRLV